MKIDKFKLISGGMDGIEVWRTEPVKKGNIVSLDSVHRIRRVQLDRPLRQKIQGLKYFFLHLTRHWISPYDKYFDNELMMPMKVPEGKAELPMGHRYLLELWNSSSITGVSIKEAGFVITGVVEVLDGKKIGLSTPFVTSDDDYHFFLEATGMINDICDEINKYLYSRLLPLQEAREEYMIENNLSTLSEDQENALTEMLIQKLQDKGAIILMNENPMEALEAVNMNEEVPEVVINTPRQTIADGMYTKSEEVDEDMREEDDGPLVTEDEEQIIIPENKGVVPGNTLVAESTEEETEWK